jgi:GTPase SAR1 family protein|tara:strand:+ start:817 stop:1938 length:1122 start_codon:yes stop_codon:yes gene_type:complete
MEVGVCKIGVLPEISDISSTLLVLASIIIALIVFIRARNDQLRLQRWLKYSVLLFSFVLFFLGMTACNQPEVSLYHNLRAIVSVIGVVVLICLTVYVEKRKQSAILLIGTAGSGKTVLTWGLLKYLGEKYPDFCHGPDSDNRILSHEVEKSFSEGSEVDGTSGLNSNRISFSINLRSKEEFVIYDFGGESLAQYSPVSRERRISNLFKSMTLDINNAIKDGHLVKQLSHLIIKRSDIKHVVFLIKPDANGVYPHKDVLSTLQSNIQLVEELTMRTSQTLNSNVYSSEVKKYRPQAHRIRVHCLFTQYSNRNLNEMGKDQSVELLKEISPDLNRLVNQSGGTRQFVNFIRMDESSGTFEKDYYMVDTLGKTLMR